jgi:transcriptional antiterminator
MMIELDVKCIEILKLLLGSNKPLPAQVISQELSLTARMVQYRMHKIEIWLKPRGVSLTIKPGYGFTINASEETKADIYRQLLVESEKPHSHSYQERLRIILIGLLTRTDPITIKQLQSQLAVARTTIIKDLHKAQAWLKDYQIQLLKRQNYGCIVEGPEINLRKALSALVIEGVGEINLLMLIGNLKQIRLQQIADDGQVQKEIRLYLQSLNIEFYNDLLNLIQDISHERFTDRAHTHLVLQLAIMTQRITGGRVVEIPASDVDILRSKSHFHLAATIVEKLHKSSRIKISDPEIAYLTLLLIEAEVKRPMVNEAIIRSTSDAYGQDVQVVVDTLLKQATLYLHPALWLDKDLKDSLISHIVRILHPTHTNSQKSNPLLEDIKQIYPAIFKVAEVGLDLVRASGWSANEDEVGFITMHFAAAMERLRLPSRRKKKVIIICNAGIATSRLLESRILKEFPGIEIEGVLSYLEYKKEMLSREYDLVITTVPISNWEKPAIIISPFLDKNDVLRIRDALDTVESASGVDQNTDYLESLQYPLSSLLTLDTIEMQVMVETWEEVVDHAGMLLLKISAIEPRYIEAMKSIRIQHGPYMVIMPGVALLHAYPEDGVKRLCMSLITLKKPVAFGHPEYDPVSLAIALGAVDNNSHIRALSELMKMLQDDTAVNVIRNTYLRARVLNIVSKVSHS